MSKGKKGSEPGYLEKDWAFDSLYTDMLHKFTLPILINVDANQAIRSLHQTLRKHLPRKPNLDFCEIGCAPGQWLIYFSQYFKYRVFGVDISREGVILTRANLKSAGLEGDVLYGDAFELPFGARTFDVVFSHSLIEHFENPMALLELYDRMTAPGGYIYCGMPNLRFLNNLIYKVNDRVLKKFQELREAHNLDAARPDFLKKAAAQFGWEIQYLGYLGFFNPTLFNPPKSDSTGVERFTLGRFVGKKMVTSRFFSPVLCMIAQKSH